MTPPRGHLRSAHNHPLTCLVLCSCLLVWGFARSGFAQDAPTDLPELPEPVPDPPVAAPSPEPTVASPPSVTPPSEAPLPERHAPSPPVAPAPPTGNAAFAPLLEERSKPKPRPRPATVGALPSRDSEPKPPPLVQGSTQTDAPPAEVHHQEQPEKDDTDGVLGPFRIGVLVGGGLPELLSLGGQIKLTRFVGAGLNIGLIPTVKISYYGDATLSYQEYDAYGRVYPFGGAFFVGAGVGYATIKGTLNSRISTADAPAMYSAGIPNPILVDSEGSVRTLVLTPQIGFMKIFDSGFTIGLDVGAQLPIAPSKVDFTTQTPNLPELARDYVQATYIKPNDDKVRSTLDTIGRTPLPTFSLKIGWFL